MRSQPPRVDQGRRATDRGPVSVAVGSSEGRHQRTYVLIVACLAQFMVILDVAVVNVAIPKMTPALGLSTAGQQWVIDSYTLTFGGLLLLGGRLSDLFGQRRVFLVGVALFTSSSLACGLAYDQLMIELARGAQGVGGAIMAPTSLSLITTEFTEPEQRTRAISLWATVSASGSAAGVLLGGVLTSAISWRWVFFVNVPVGLLIATTALTKVRLTPVLTRRRLDVAGIVLVTASLSLVVFALIGVNNRGWTAPKTLALFSGGVLALAAFVFVEARLAPDPALPLGLLKDRQRAAANGLFAIAGAVIVFMYFDISLYLQRVDGDGPLKAGASFLPATIATTFTALNGRRLMAVLGTRRQLWVGTILQAAGFVWLASIGVHSHYWAHIGLPMVVIGLGIGLTFVPGTAAATHAVPSHQAGIASGVLNTSRQVGGAIGLAALTTVASSGLGSHPSLSAVAHGDRIALHACAGLALLAALISCGTTTLGRSPLRSSSS